MPKPYSIDLRERVVAAMLSGSTYQEAAERFGARVASISRWLGKHRREGTAEPAAFGGRKASALAPHAGKMRALVEGGPDPTLDAMRERLAEDRIRTSPTTCTAACEASASRKNRRSGRPTRIVPRSPKRASPGSSAKPN